ELSPGWGVAACRGWRARGAARARRLRRRRPGQRQLQQPDRSRRGRPDQRDGRAPLVLLPDPPRRAMSTVDSAIEAFWTCARNRTAPSSEWMKRLSREEAYRVQLGVLARHVQAGQRHAGWKVGLTSKAMQTQQKGQEPVPGFLLDT